MHKLLQKPSGAPAARPEGRFERFNLRENPFPSEPAVNPNSDDKRINGQIYAAQIRQKELEQIRSNFISVPQSDRNHLRLGFIADRSFVGRGNGKSAFLVNLRQKINANYCLDLSDGVNKCGAILVNPEAGGRTKTFPQFVDAFFLGMRHGGIIKESLAALRLDALQKINPSLFEKLSADNETEAIDNLNEEKWFHENSVDLMALQKQHRSNDYLLGLPPSFPLQAESTSLVPKLVTVEDFEDYYRSVLRRPKDKLDFVFNDLVRFFLAAGFNGMFVLVDDFERIPDFQSARQKKDFALELRSCLFDGTYLNAKLGFYNFLMVMHAGVPGIIADAWSSAGMEHRAPVTGGQGSHMINFGKLSPSHAEVLLKTYLSEYRLKKAEALDPFTKDAVKAIGEVTEYNAAKILRMAYEALEKTADDPEGDSISGGFVKQMAENQGFQEEEAGRQPRISDEKSVDLERKIDGEAG